MMEILIHELDTLLHHRMWIDDFQNGRLNGRVCPFNIGTCLFIHCPYYDYCSNSKTQRGKACWIPKNVCDTIIRLYNRRIICTEAVMLRNLNVAKCKVYSLYKSKHKKEKNKRKNLEYEKTANEDHINSYLHKSR